MVVVDLAGGGWWVDVVVGGAESSWVERERERIQNDKERIFK